MNKRYTIVRHLGKGGMGTVYLASETIANQQRVVVIKEMLDYFDPNDPQSEAKARERFEAEAGTLARLNFAGIPQIFDYFSEKGRNYIVMQFVEGDDLESKLTHTDDQGNTIRGGPYPADQVRVWGAQICKVLEKLAARKIVHMDIKPANLIVDSSGDVWLVDFGTAKAQRTIQPGGQVGMQKSSVYGTAGYAPHEQYSGQAGPRSDVYALAATLYHLLTDDDPREHPFSFPQLGQLSDDLRQALEQALAQKPAQRCDASKLRRMLAVHSTSHPFTWSDGTTSYTVEELAHHADARRAEAADHLYQRRFEKWLADDLKRTDLARKVTPIIQVNQATDMGLDEFLQLLDPTRQKNRWRTLWHRLSPPLDWGLLGALAGGLTFTTLAFLLYSVADVPLWIPVIVLGAVGLILALIIRDDSRLLWGAFGTATGGLLGWGLHAGVALLVRVLGNPWPAVLLGMPVGMAAALIWQRVKRPRHWQVGGYALNGLLSLGLITVSIFGNLHWAAREIPRAITYRKAAQALKVQAWEESWLLYQELCEQDATYRDACQQMLQSAYLTGEYWLDEEEWEDAQDAFAFILEQSPGFAGAQSGWIESQAEPCYQAGEAARKTAAWAEAQSQFACVLSIAPDYKDAAAKLLETQTEPHYLTGQSFLDEQAWDQAQAEFEAVLALQPGYKDAESLLLVARLERFYLDGQQNLEEGKWEQAIRAFDQILTVETEYKDTLELRAEAYEGWKAALYTLGTQQSETYRWEAAAATFAQLRALTPVYRDVATLAQQPELESALLDYYHSLWQTGDFREYLTPQTQSSPVTAMAFNPVTHQFVTGHQDGTLRTWDPTNGEMIQMIAGHSKQINTLAFSPACERAASAQSCNPLLISGSADKTAAIWEGSSGRLLQTLSLHSNAITQVAFSADGALLATLDQGTGIRVWETATGTFLYLKADELANAQKLCFSPQGVLMAALTPDDTVWLFDASRGKKLNAFNPNRKIVDILFSADGSLLLAVTRNQSIIAWDISTAPEKISEPFLILTSSASAQFGFSQPYPDGSDLFALNSQGMLTWQGMPGSQNSITSSNTGQIAIPLAPDSAPINIAFSPDGWLLAVLDAKGSVTIYAAVPPQTPAP